MSKDWTGNETTLFAALGASNHSEGDREQNDYYATDPQALVSLLAQKKLPHIIYECACGSGHLSMELEKEGTKLFQLT